MSYKNIPELGNLPFKSKITILSGAGMSAESGISTFRDSGGLWERYDISEVATPQAWEKNQQLVQDFYNQRRKQLLQVKPNDAHKALVKLEGKYEVSIITQNIDDLHERAGSKNVLHLHGELRKSQSSVNPELVYDVNGWEIKTGQKCELGSQLRPNVVWFGEAVPMIEPAQRIISESNLVIVIGTSLNVYPAAGLLYDVAPNVTVIAVDPADLELDHLPKAIHYREKAVTGVKNLVASLLNVEH